MTSLSVCLRASPISAVNKSHFQFHYVIGRGGFGKVGVLCCTSLTSLCSPRAGVESREEENGAVLCDEGDVQVAYYYEALRQLGDERAKAPRPAEAPVRAFLLLNRLTCAFSGFS